MIMKQPPDKERLEGILRSSKLGSGGFFGEDTRTLDEIVEADAVAVRAMDLTCGQIAARMREITGKARAALEDIVVIDGVIEAEAIEVKGRIPCPWPHSARFDKVVVIARRLDTGKKLMWSDLSIHMIEDHGFFEGKGSSFRLEPSDLVEVIFSQKAT